MHCTCGLFYADMFLNLPPLDGYSLASLLGAHPAIAQSAAGSARQQTPSGASSITQSASSARQQTPSGASSVSQSASSARQQTPSGASSVNPLAAEDDDNEAALVGGTGAGPLVEFKSKPTNDRCPTLFLVCWTGAPRPFSCACNSCLLFMHLC